MTDAVHDTFSIERSYSQSPGRVFGAFADPIRKRRWYGESDDHVIETFEHEFAPGGMERLTYRFKEGTPFAGHAVTSEGTHLDIVPDTRIVIASTMAFGDWRISASLLTFVFKPQAAGTLLVCTHQGAFFEGSDGPAGRKHGWTALLERLDAELARQ